MSAQEALTEGGPIELSGRRAITALLPVCAALHLLIGSALAGVEATRATGWTAWRWTSEDGLPLDDVTAVDFGPGGIAWIATFDGLARFDGSTFDVHRPSTHPGLPTARIVDLAVAEDGSRWLVTETGELVRGDRSGYQLVPRAETGVGQARELLRLDARLWLLGASGLAGIEGDRVTPVELKGLPPGSTLRKASPTWQGDLLVSTQGGPLLRVQPSTGQVHVVHPKTPVASSHRQEDGGGPQRARTYAMSGEDALIVAHGQLLRVLRAAGPSRRAGEPKKREFSRDSKRRESSIPPRVRPASAGDRTSQNAQTPEILGFRGRCDHGGPSETVL